MKQFAIIIGNTDSTVIKKAVENLSEFLLDYTFEYPVCIKYGTDCDLDKFRCIYIGTKNDNSYIKRNSSAILSKSEQYCIKIDNDIVIIEGFDDKGVLYGCIDFYNKYLLKREFCHNENLAFNSKIELPFEDFCLQSAPSVKKSRYMDLGTRNL